MTPCAGVIFLFSFLFLVPFGLLAIYDPQTAWSWNHAINSWAYRDSEPSDAGLVAQRIGGVICLLLGIGAGALFIWWLLSGGVLIKLS